MQILFEVRSLRRDHLHRTFLGSWAERAYSFSTCITPITCRCAQCFSRVTIEGKFGAGSVVSWSRTSTLAAAVERRRGRD